MAQIKKSFDEVRIPFTKMSFTPDVPSTQLGPNEYNDGLNVETDVRGVRSMAGDEEILRLPVPGTPTYISGGFRQDDRFWTIVATDEGYWWASTGGVWFDITPPTGPFATYTQATNITEGWNGTVPFFNDEANPPMFWPEDTGPRFATTSASSSAGTSTIGFLTQTDTLSGVNITGIAGQFSYTSAENIRVGMKMTISGTITSTPFTVSGVTITGTAGEFACTASSQPLAVGQRIDISGTFGGTGSITGYVDPSTYYIIATNGATSFQLSSTPGGSPVVTTAGTPTGLTYTIQAPSITGYSNPTTYYVIAADGKSTFQLSTSYGGSAITTVPGTLAGLTFLYSPFAIGETINVNGVSPVGFNGVHTVTAVTQSSVSFAGTTAGPQTRVGTVGVPFPQMIMYSNSVPQGISTITYVNDTTQRITFDTALTAAPYSAGEFITISDVNQFFNGTYEVVSSTTTTIDYLAQPGAVYPGYSVGSVAPEYSWNYNPNWSKVFAKFMRLYNTPNVGCILVAGDLTATNATTGQTEYYPVTVQWSQSFGLNQAPQTWTPTVINIANQLEVPLRGEALDAFPCNGQLFLCSYWDTVVFSPINYTTTSAPILGVRLFNQGRGLLSSNCWGNTDKMVYGIDARDIWVFNGQDFQGLGNQRVKNWFYDQLDPNYVDRVFMQVNSQRNQIEIYYTTVAPVITDILCVDTTGGFTCNGSDLKVNQQVRVTGTLTGTGSISGYTSPETYYIVEVTGDPAGTFFRLSATEGGTPLTTTAGTMTGLTFTVRFGDNNGVPNKMLSYRYDIDCWNAPRDVASATSATETPVRFERADTSWAFNKASRTVMYARGVADSKVVQKDQGYSFINDAPIESRFRRDNIKLLPDYSGKLMVHRLLPEIVNLNNAEIPINPVLEPTLVGSVSFKVDGANSVGQEPLDTTSQAIQTNTDDPWIQIDQNAHRVNALEVGNTSNDNLWMLSATTWQYTQTEDDR